MDKTLRQKTEDLLRDADCEQMAALVHYGANREMLREIVTFAQSPQSRTLVNFVQINKFNKEIDEYIEDEFNANW